MKDLGFTETQQAIRSTIREYLEREVEPLVAEMEAERLLPYVPIRRMVAALGFGADGELTQMIKDSPPEEMLKFFVPRILSIEMSRICAGMALSHGASLGLCAGNVLSKGTPEQKERFAGPLLRFEKIGAWALTEPQAGSSAIRDMRTTAVRDGDHWVLNGSKSPTGEVFLSDCRIPADRILGGGEQKTNVKERLSRERVGLTAISYGIMERAFDLALQYSRDRNQGGQPIGRYQLIQRRLARMYTALSNCRQIVYGDIWAGKRIDVSPADASVGKLYVAEMSTYVCQEAIHVLAGNGYMEEYVVERLFRDAKLIELGGGTTEIQELTAGRWLVENYQI